MHGEAYFRNLTVSLFAATGVGVGNSSAWN